MDVIAQDEDLSERIGTAEICKKLRSAVNTELTEREAKIIRMRYGLDGAEEMTQRQAAEHFGISRSYVSRIEKHALQKLRLALGEEAKPT